MGNIAEWYARHTERDATYSGQSLTTRNADVENSAMAVGLRSPLVSLPTWVKLHEHKIEQKG